MSKNVKIDDLVNQVNQAETRLAALTADLDKTHVAVEIKRRDLGEAVLSGISPGTLSDELTKLEQLERAQSAAVQAATRAVGEAERKSFEARRLVSITDVKVHGEAIRKEAATLLLAALDLLDRAQMTTDRYHECTNIITSFKLGDEISTLKFYQDATTVAYLKDMLNIWRRAVELANPALLESAGVVRRF